MGLGEVVPGEMPKRDPSFRDQVLMAYEHAVLDANVLYPAPLRDFFMWHVLLLLTDPGV